MAVSGWDAGGLVSVGDLECNREEGDGLVRVAGVAGLMTVGELVDILVEVDHDRMVYIHVDGKAKPLVACVDMKYRNCPTGIAISDDVLLVTYEFIEGTPEEEVEA